MHCVPLPSLYNYANLRLLSLVLYCKFYIHYSQLSIVYCIIYTDNYCSIMPGYRISVSKGKSVQPPLLVAVITLSALTTIVSILFWRLHYDGGFTWNSDPGKQFSWHPLLMTMSIIFLGFGSIMYRITPCMER